MATVEKNINEASDKINKVKRLDNEIIIVD